MRLEGDALQARCREIRLVLLDVDGVLTDGRLHYDASGDAGRRFHVRDGSAVKLAMGAGLQVGILSGKTSAAVAHRAQDLGLTEVHQGERVKAPAWERMLARLGLPERQVAYMGDDWLDLSVLRRAGLSAAPCDASHEVLDAVHFVARAPGGGGCVRELLELVMRAQGTWVGAVEAGLRGGPRHG